MANLAVHNYHLKFQPNSIEIGKFVVPTGTVNQLETRDKHNVRVWFTGAMGLTKDVVIDFHLHTADKVNEFASAMLEKTTEKSLNEEKVHYTISPAIALKDKYPIQKWASPGNLLRMIATLSVYEQMASEHPRLAPIYSPLFQHCTRMFETQGLNGFNMEILNNLYSEMRDNPLSPAEMDSILKFGKQETERY